MVAVSLFAGLFLAANESPVSCAASCLYLLCRDLERPCRLRDAVVQLPHRVDGWSMQDVVTAGRQNGLSLRNGRAKDGSITRQALHSLSRFIARSAHWSLPLC